MTGHESSLAALAREPSSAPRKILIVGGGPAGLEAARVAAGRGHEVILCEKSKQLGGTLRFAALVYEPNERLLDWLVRQVLKLDIDLRLETEVTVSLIREISPDEILVAVGARRRRLEIPGAHQNHVFDGDELRELLTGDGVAGEKLSMLGRLSVRLGRAIGITQSPRLLRKASRFFMPVGSKVVVVGGGLVGLELAEFLADRGRAVTVLESGPKFGLEMAHPRRWRVLHDLREQGVQLVANVTLHSIGPTEVEYRHASEPQAEDATKHAFADTVILATGLERDHTLTERLRESGIPVREIGDVGHGGGAAPESVGNHTDGLGYLEGAIHDGFHAAIDR
jgi:NADPH-dependent 2,4-dienoyl-CoA reductase/sulfur reductase-like enzyme